MYPIRRSQWILIALSLVALRFLIGLHFFFEGTSKLRDGDFSAEGFFRNANGPAAPFFRGLIDDGDGRLRLGLVEVQGADGSVEWALDPLVTEETWRAFLYRASRIYRFEDPGLMEQLLKRRGDVEQRLASASLTADERDLLQTQLAADAKSLELLSQQKAAGLAIVDRYAQQLRNLLQENRVEILAYFRGEDRLSGFSKDGQGRTQVLYGVASLYDQTQTIARERSAVARAWLAEVNAMWDGVDSEINALATEQQTVRGPVRLERPWKPRYSVLQSVNRVIPWFDTVVGVLLVLGLFTRMASVAGALLLLGVISTQPPFVYGSVPTIYQSIELVGLMVVFATNAGRIAGFDGLWAAWRLRGPAPRAERAEGEMADRTESAR